MRSSTLYIRPPLGGLSVQVWTGGPSYVLLTNTIKGDNRDLLAETIFWKRRSLQTPFLPRGDLPVSPTPAAANWSIRWLHSVFKEHKYFYYIICFSGGATRDVPWHSATFRDIPQHVAACCGMSACRGKPPGKLDGNPFRNPNPNTDPLALPWRYAIRRGTCRGTSETYNIRFFPWQCPPHAAS